MVPIFKGKGDELECNKYRGITLMNHIMKPWERIIEARLRDITKIADNQFDNQVIDYRTDICIENTTGEVQREKQRDPHGFRRTGESVRSSTPIANMMEPTKEKSSRSIH